MHLVVYRQSTWPDPGIRPSGEWAPPPHAHSQPPTAFKMSGSRSSRLSGENKLEQRVGICLSQSQVWWSRSDLLCRKLALRKLFHNCLSRLVEHRLWGANCAADSAPRNAESKGTPDQGRLAGCVGRNRALRAHDWPRAMRVHPLCREQWGRTVGRQAVVFWLGDGPNDVMRGGTNAQAWSVVGFLGRAAKRLNGM